MRMKTDKSLSTLERELDDVFSDFIRLRDRKVGNFINCFVCGVTVPWQQSHNGHYISRAHMATRYNENNCNAVCIDCNCFDPDHQNQYRLKMIGYYGLRVVELLEGQKRNLQKFVRYEIQEMIDHYKIEVRKLKRV